MPIPELDLPGRLTCTRKRHGDPDSMYALKLDGATLFKLQHFLETSAEESHAYFTIREHVLLAEQIREAVLNQKEKP